MPPFFLFPRRLSKFLGFHREVIRPIIVARSGTDERKNKESTILLHSRTGESLDSWRITKTLKTFLMSIDPELKNVTSMAIRGSYAIMMLKFYRERKIFRELTQEQFLELLAKMMNTFVHQLVNAYVSNGEQDFRGAAKEMAFALVKRSDDGKNISVEEESDSENSKLNDWAASMWN